MKTFKEIAGLNLAILLAYSIVIGVAGRGSGRKDDLSIMIFSAMAVGLHVLVGIVITSASYAWDKPEEGRAWLASTGIVLLVGFSVCLGNAAL